MIFKFFSNLSHALNLEAQISPQKASPTALWDPCPFTYIHFTCKELDRRRSYTIYKPAARPYKVEVTSLGQSKVQKKLNVL